MSEVKDVIVQGLWKNNFVLVQLLGMCFLLVVILIVINVFGLGLVIILVLILINLIIFSLCCWMLVEIWIFIYVMIIVLVVSVVQMLINVYVFGFYQLLGIFILFIVINCIVVGCVEVFVVKKGLVLLVLDGFLIGMGVICVMFVLGFLCEIFGNGILFDGVDSLFGSWVKVLCIEVFYIDIFFLLVMLLSGVFIGFGMMLVIKYFIDECSKQWKV